MEEIKFDGIEMIRHGINRLCRFVVLHGGPCTYGSMRDLAVQLGKCYGILEPKQSQCTLDDLMYELRRQIEKEMVLPVILIGHSWGAWLAAAFASHYPDMISRVIMIGSPPLMDQYGKDLIEEEPEGEEPMNLPLRQELLDIARKDRESGELLKNFQEVCVNITVFQGEKDSYPWEGVVKPLEQIGKNVTVHRLPNSGHTPWLDEGAEEFYQILMEELPHSKYNNKPKQPEWMDRIQL